jgi:hypothetical protein
VYNLEAAIEKIESEITDDPSRHAFLKALKARLAERQRAEAQSGITRLTKEKSGDSGESGESALQPQSLPTGSEVGPGETDSLACDSGDSASVSDNARRFAAALDSLDPALRETASDLYDHLHYKSKFAQLTSVQREAIVQLLRHRTCEDVAKILAEPPPIGMNLRTSKAGVIRFREDFMHCAMQESKLKAHAAAEDQRLAADEAFQTVNASDDIFNQTTALQIRKRLFQAVQDPRADYHEIRWLIKSLEMLREAIPSQ